MRRTTIYTQKYNDRIFIKDISSDVVSTKLSPVAGAMKSWIVEVVLMGIYSKTEIADYSICSFHQALCHSTRSIRKWQR